LLDTNVLVSAFTTRGLCSDIFRVILAEYTLLSGEVVLDELERVLLSRFRVPPATVAEILALLKSSETVAKPASPSPIAVRDPDDAWVLASALAGRAELLITGDQNLLVVGDVPGLRIRNPRGAWSLLKAT
jgi:putative PIN family toxin of toxin-antitoxin system